jgi:hypothetical protein
MHSPEDYSIWPVLLASDVTEVIKRMEELRKEPNWYKTAAKVAAGATRGAIIHIAAFNFLALTIQSRPEYERLISQEQTSERPPQGD